VWIIPEIVWEVKCADLTLSSHHTGAKGQADPSDKSRGIGLRFPRFLRARPDKTPVMATTSFSLAQMYRSQSTIDVKQDASDDE
jgi:DNA ligase-1